jgi:hypothetical protein
MIEIQPDRWRWKESNVWVPFMLLKLLQFPPGHCTLLNFDDPTEDQRVVAGKHMAGSPTCLVSWWLFVLLCLGHLLWIKPMSYQILSFGLWQHGSCFLFTLRYWFCEVPFSRDCLLGSIRHCVILVLWGSFSSRLLVREYTMTCSFDMAQNAQALCGGSRQPNFHQRLIWAWSSLVTQQVNAGSFHHQIHSCLKKRSDAIDLSLKTCFCSPDVWRWGSNWYR